MNKLTNFLTAIVIAAATAAHAAEIDSPRPVVKNQGFLPFANAPINYRSADVDDPIARLEAKVASGEISLPFEAGHSYLRAVLAALKIPVNSQTLVFSKTSFQFPQINTAAPRALYYNDDVYVGQVQNGKFLEFVSFDPLQGPIFYVMDERNADRPRFERAAIDCVQCHVAKSTRGVPGVMLRSVFTKPDGQLTPGAKSFVTGHESPMQERWGGWYVTAAQGADSGMATGPAGKFDASAYLTGSSDLVALMVLAHQTQMHNYITQTNYRTRIALAGGLSSQQFEGPAEELVRYLLFADEAKLDAPVQGNTSFAKDFAARGPFDSQGRSLREFDLKKRIFKYPCSYLIYSESFDALPQPAKDYVFRRLFEILSGQDQSPTFASLTAEDRRAVLEILVETKPGLPSEWKQFVTNRATTAARAINPNRQH